MTLAHLNKAWLKAKRGLPAGFSPEGLIQAVEGWTSQDGSLTRPVALPIKESELLPIYKAAKLYVVARDEGMGAALLWKLSQP